MTKSILITGAGGQVGHELASSESQHRLTALTRQQLDITSAGQIDKTFLRVKPDIVINAAAYTDVDRAESESSLAYAVNRDGVERLSEACLDTGIPLFHLSTDYVFDGNRQGAYQESDPIVPLGIYGASKAAGEAVARKKLKQHLILRTSWVFSGQENNFVHKIMCRGRECTELAIVDDQHGCPTSARSIAAVLMQIAELYLSGGAMQWGTFHYCNKPATTWYGFAREIFKLAGGFENLKLKPISSVDYSALANRPSNSVLDCTKIESVYGIQPVYWSNELAEQFCQGTLFARGTDQSVPSGSI